MDLITPQCYDTTGRHLVMMPHIERSTFQWNWLIIQLVETMRFRHEAFVNARQTRKVILLIIVKRP
jgi:phosphoribosylformylglycinamidine synthase